MASDDVRKAQQALQADGVYHGRIDGIAGPQTRRAVLRYQKRNNLQQTGVLDGQTMARLESGERSNSYGGSDDNQSSASSPSTTGEAGTSNASGSDGASSSQR